MVGIFTYFICWYLHAMPWTIEVDKRTGRRASRDTIKGCLNRLNSGLWYGKWYIYIYTKKLQQWIYSNESFCNQFPYAICIFLLFVFGGRYTRSESPIFNGRPSSTIGYGWELGLITTLEILLVCEITTLVGWNQKTTYRYVEYITSHNSWHHSENWYALVMSSTLNPRVPRRLAFGCYGPYHLRHDTLWNQAK